MLDSDAIDVVNGIADKIKPAPPEGGYTVAMDFHGVLSRHEEGDGIDKIGEPLEFGIKLAKRIVAAGHKLVVLTAVPENQHDTILGWLKGQGVKAYEVTNVKPPAKYYIDDRAIRWPRNFDGKMKKFEAAVEGGPGSGPKKRGGKSAEDKSERAKSSYVMVTAEKYQKAKRSEEAVAKAIGGKSVPDNAAFDVTVGKAAIEVKTIDAGRNDKITMHPKSLDRKVKEAKKMGVRTYTVVVDTRGSKSEIYFREGLGSFRLGSMEKLRSLDDLRKKVKS